MTESASPQSPRNPLRRFWQGGYSLPLSYWLVYVLGGLLVVPLIAALGTAARHLEYTPVTAAVVVTLGWGLAIGVTVFQVVGTWRSAGRYRTERRRDGRSGLWGVAAQGMLLVTAASLVWQVARYGLPQVREAAAIAFAGDPTIPDYIVRRIRDGREIEVAGGLKYGVTRDLERVLAESPQAAIVHLNSIGGRLGEARKLADLIRARGLAVYTATQCDSACTIAFRAGRERWLGPSGRLGFHRSAFGGVDSADTMRRDMLDAGYPKPFVDKAVSWPSDKMWFPTTEELAAAQVITGVVDSHRFALSGYGAAPDRATFRTALGHIALFAAAEQAAPGTLDTLAGQALEAYRSGASEGALTDTFREQTVMPLIRARLPLAATPVLADYARLLADQYEFLAKADPAACFAYAVGSAGSGRAVALLGPALRQREAALSERVLASPAAKRDQRPDALDTAYAKVFRSLAAQYGEAEARLLLEANRVKPDQYAAYCRLGAAMFRAFADLPPDDAGRVLDAVFRNIAAAPAK
ncbi:MAG: hypothetical protein U1E23_00535 [Reyranellaceae bacterium]